MYWTNGVANLHHVDARQIPLDDKSVHCVVTSPPYWGLRNYGLGSWSGGEAECEHRANPDSDADGTYHEAHAATIPGGWRQSGGEVNPTGRCGKCGATQAPDGIGLEPTLGEWVENIVAVMREVRRVLRDDGTVWLNLGDSYSSGASSGFRAGSGRADGIVTDASPRNRNGVNFPGLAPKNLIGQPWRVAFALQDDRWILRSAIVWHKPNPMPESCTDRPTSAYEMLFLLSKQGRYFYDAATVREPLTGGAHARRKDGSHRYVADRGKDANDTRDSWQDSYQPTAANARNVWMIPTQGRPDAHFATFPDELPRRCILAGTSEKGVCAECGAPWERETKKEMVSQHGNNRAEAYTNRDRFDGAKGIANSGHVPARFNIQTLGWQSTCGHEAGTVPATVLDPFVGSGTTCAVAQALGRRSIGLDLNPEYLDIAAQRIGAVTLPLV